MVAAAILSILYISFCLYYNNISFPKHCLKSKRANMPRYTPAIAGKKWPGVVLVPAAHIQFLVYLLWVANLFQKIWTFVRNNLSHLSILWCKLEQHLQEKNLRFQLKQSPTLDWMQPPLPTNKKTTSQVSTPQKITHTGWHFNNQQHHKPPSISRAHVLPMSFSHCLVEPEDNHHLSRPRP